MSILIRNGYVLTLDEGDHILDRGDIFIRNSEIAAIGTDLNATKLDPERVIEAEGKLVMPGLVNADLHSAENLLKGCFENLPLELSMLYSDPPVGIAPPEPELIYTSALLGAVEMLKTGVTMVVDDCQQAPGPVSKATQALFSAYRDVGIRASIALGIGNESLPDKIPSLRQVLSLPLLAALQVNHAGATEEQLIESYENTFSTWHEAEHGRLRVALAPLVSQCHPGAFLDWLRQTSTRRNAALHLHVEQTRWQASISRQRYNGRTAVQHADDLALLTPRTTVVSAIWLASEDVRVLADKQVSLVYNPISELYYGGGIMPIDRLLAARINIALGTGGVGSNGNLNMGDAMKMAASLHRITQPNFAEWPSTDQVLHMATIAGARSCLLQGHTGRLTVGSKADLVLYDRRAIPLTPLNNVKTQLVCLERGDSVDTVIVDGRVVVESGRILTVNEQEVLAHARKLHPLFMAQRAQAEHFSAQLLPYVSQLYYRSAEESAGAARSAPNQPSRIADSSGLL